MPKSLKTRSGTGWFYTRLAPLYVKYTFFVKSQHFVFELQTLWLKDFTEIFQLKGLKLENKGHTNFYECCDLTKKVYLGPVEWDRYAIDGMTYYITTLERAHYWAVPKKQENECCWFYQLMHRRISCFCYCWLPLPISLIA